MCSWEREILLFEEGGSKVECWEIKATAEGLLGSALPTRQSEGGVS